jgi:hypothetical protein
VNITDTLKMVSMGTKQSARTELGLESGLESGIGLGLGFGLGGNDFCGEIQIDDSKMVLEEVIIGSVTLTGNELGLRGIFCIII